MAKKATKPGRKKAAPPPLRLEWLDPDSLDDNPANWRTHPQAQTDALRDVIAEAGWAGALLYNERTKRLIDGHARKALFAGKGSPVPVLVGSWSEEQERLILATLDPLGVLAGADATSLATLLRGIEVGSDALAEMLSSLSRENPLASLAGGSKSPALPGAAPPDPVGEWQGMPEFEHEDKESAYRAIVHFRTEEDLAAFEELLGQKVPRNRWAIWYPEAEVERFADKRYVADGRKDE